MRHVTRDRAGLPRRWSVGLGVAAAGIMGVVPLIAGGSASATVSRSPKSVVISTVKNSKLGTILVSRTTLYSLKPSKTGCTGQCAKFWPMVVLPKGVTRAAAGNGVSAAKLGTVSRAGGARQVTYAGKALYRFSGDRLAGQVNGNGLKDAYGTWSVIVTVKAKPTPSTTTTTPGSGGYGAY